MKRRLPAGWRPTVSTTNLTLTDKIASNIWSIFGLGHIPIFPSFWGALAALPVSLLLLYLGWRWYLAVYLVIFLLAWLAVSRSLKLAAPEQPRVVVDKFLGYLTTMFFVPQYSFLRWPWLWGLFLFLLLEAVGGLFLKAREKKPDKGVYILVDDVVCGILACLAMWVVAAMHNLLQGDFVPAIFAQ